MDQRTFGRYSKGEEMSDNISSHSKKWKAKQKLDFEKKMGMTKEKVEATEKSRKLKQEWKLEIPQPLGHYAELNGYIYTNMWSEDGSDEVYKVIDEDSDPRLIEKIDE